MSDIDPAPLARGRGRIKSSITKFLNFANAITDSTTLLEIEIRLSRIEDLVKEFISYDDVLGDVVGYEHEYDDFEDKIITLKTILIEQKNKRICLTTINPEQSTSRRVTNDGAESNISCEIIEALTKLTESQQVLAADSARGKVSFETILPKLNIKAFTGEYKDWPTFNDQFTKIHQDTKLSGIQKFTYLRSLLEPEPLLLIENILLTNDNYEAAWKKLSKRYNNKRKIITSYIESFFRQKSIHDGSADEIRGLADKVENLLSGIDSIDPTKCRDIWLIHILLNKLDESTKKLWAEKLTDMYEKDLLEEKYFPTMDEFLKFLDDRRSTLESIQEFSLLPNKKRSFGNSLKFNKVRCNFGNNQQVQLCQHCKLPHTLSKCFKFKKLTTQQKREFVNKQSLCFNCLRDGHRAVNCPSDQRCQSCSGNHHSILHFEKSNNYNTNTLESAVSEPGRVSHAVNQSTQDAQQNKMLVSGRTQHANSYTSSIDNLSNSVLTRHKEVMMQNAKCSKLSPIVEPFFSQGKELNNNVIGQNERSSTFPLFQKEISSEISNELMTCKVSGPILSLLPTAEVGVSHADADKVMSCNMLLDSGSQISFITESLVEKLKLTRKKSQLTVNGLSSSGSVTTKGVVTLKLSSMYNDKSIIIKAFILKSISSNLPAQYIDTSNWHHLENLDLADKRFYCPKRVDLLLGADQFFNILKPEKLNVGLGMPTLQNTIFGWIVAGAFQACADAFKIEIQSESCLDDQLKKFWELEEIPNQKHDEENDEEMFCEENFKQHCYVNEVGKFVVKLPFVSNSPDLGNSVHSATKRLLALERRLINDEALYEEYRKFMAEYLELGHMKVIPYNEIKIENNKCYYLPHHLVVKPDSQTTRCRVVFDGSAKSQSGISLNNKLAVGPTIQPNLQTTLINFRIPKIVLCGDIEKMYRQVEINTEHQDFQRILWRNDSSQPIQHYRLRTVTYGTASAPFLATRCLKQIALDCHQSHPTASNAILNNFYVDDFIAGAGTVQETIILRDQVSSLLKKRGFVLRKWCSNSELVLKSISNKDAANSLVDFNERDKTSLKVLGLFWQPTEDYFTFKVHVNFDVICTKRNILSEASKIFDPMGFLSPTTVAVKIIFQQLWLKKYLWDDVLPEDISNKWSKIQHNFKFFENLKISRWFGTPGVSEELFGFSDASELAYSAVIYLKSTDENSKVNINLLFAKTKVAPLKQVSIPRLELCAANLLTKMYQFVITLPHCKNLKITAFSDSSVVLSWLASHPRRWKTFVANRTSQIIEVIPTQNWRHVKSKDNPADCASRGISPEQLLNHHLWWTGPKWLAKNQAEWPESSFNVNDENVSIECESRKIISTFIIQEQNDVIESLFNKISSLSKIIRIIAYCRRFIMSLKTKNDSFLSSEELKVAEKLCIKWAQRQHFQEEINSLISNKPIQRKSSLYNIDPFLDDDELLRVLGRLEHSTCSYDSKHPLIVPKKHILGKLIVKHIHYKHLHAGPSLTLNISRQKFWIIGARNLIKKEVSKCIVCTRYKAVTSQQMMANLPKERVTPSRPFLQTGLDYAGPFTIRWNKGRNAKTNKAYLAIFVCLSTKAVHLELVSDLTSEAFIASLRRFIGRRGNPANIFSDNGTNFVGAKRQLSSLYYAAFEDSKSVHGFLAENFINWHMIPPAAPHFGGIWESGVRSAKFHLKRVLGDHILTFEELSTLFVQIEAQLNSRPLTPIYDGDTESLDVLTPGHFLIGCPLVSLTEPSLMTTNLSSRDRWQLVTKMQQDFWRRWHRDYLNSLQQRKKWHNENKNLQIGNIVLIKEDNLPPSSWALGRIQAVHPGSDGLVRVTTIKTAKTTIKRPITKLIKLPIEDDG